MKADAIAVVEAVYELSLDRQQWMEGVLERAAPLLDRGLGIGATMWRLGSGPMQSTMVTRGMDPRVLDALLAAARDDPEGAHRQATSGMILGTATQRLGLAEHEYSTIPVQRKHLSPLGVVDGLNLQATDPSGLILLLTAPMPDTRRPSRRERGMWERIAAHMGAGARLRAAVRAGANDGVGEGVEAILSPSGTVQHAEPAAQPRPMRAALRRAALAVDRARSKQRADWDGALDLWQGLVAGRWSLVDRFDSDGRRFVVARRNDPHVTDPRALTLRERQVLAYVAMGHSLKLVAYSLGLSVSTVALHRARAMRKLGLRSVAEVARIFAGR